MELKPKERDQINQFYNTYGRGFKLFREYRNYNEGDVLVRRNQHSATGEYDPVSASCPIPKKFKVVCVDEFDVPWIKQIGVKGGLGKKMHTPVDQAGVWVYEIDPEMLNAQILQAEYDPREEYRKWREANPNYGKSKDTEEP